jgi:hypothetical protein
MDTPPKDSRPAALPRCSSCCSFVKKLMDVAPLLTPGGDAKHLRDLLMISRLPESWIPPDHILDLRARVRLRHTLSQQRGEWQQRIQAVLYHHGLPQRRDLLTRENRAWVEQAALPDSAREQITVALAMIDALEVQLAPIDKELRAYAPPGRLPCQGNARGHRRPRSP